MIEVSLIPIGHVLQVWDDVQIHLEKAVPYSKGRYSIEDILSDCVRGEQHLWIVFEKKSLIHSLEIIGAFTTRISLYPRRKTLNLQFCGGERMKEWAVKVNDTLERFARDNGCDCLEMTGRDGWERVLAPLGWKTVFKVYEKALKDG